MDQSERALLRSDCLGCQIRFWPQARRSEPVPGASHVMPQRSAGILLYRRRSGSVEVLLVHPGGPFWVNKDEGVWSIPKGVYEPGEDALAAAKREFAEETGAQVAGEPVSLGSFRQST